VFNFFDYAKDLTDLIVHWFFPFKEENESYSVMEILLMIVIWLLGVVALVALYLLYHWYSTK
jgi:hypothetical protein